MFRQMEQGMYILEVYFKADLWQEALPIVLFSRTVIEVQACGT